jgi:hypothetical protein
MGDAQVHLNESTVNGNVHSKHTEIKESHIYGNTSTTIGNFAKSVIYGDVGTTKAKMKESIIYGNISATIGNFAGSVTRHYSKLQPRARQAVSRDCFKTEHRSNTLTVKAGQRCTTPASLVTKILLRSCLDITLTC